MKYVECDYCGKHIHEGDKCYNDRYCTIYCSPKCMLKDQFLIGSKELDDSLIESRWIYNNKYTQKRSKYLWRKMSL